MVNRKINNLVQIVLDVDEDARDDDSLLYQYIIGYINQDYLKESFGWVMRHQKKLGLPSFESVSRARRKAQELHPELRASADTEAARMLEEERFREWATSSKM